MTNVPQNQPHAHSLSTESSATHARDSYMFAPPPVPVPSMDVSEIERMRKLMTAGMVKAVVGSKHVMRRTVKETIEEPDPKDPKKTRSRTRDREERVERTVLSIHTHPSVERRYVCLSCPIVGDDEAALLADHRAQFGSDAEMRRQGIAHVYCAETLTPVQVPIVSSDPRNGRAASTVANEIALLSDREPGDGPKGPARE